MLDVYGRKSLLLRVLKAFKCKKGFIVSEWFYNGCRLDLIKKGLDR